MHDRALQQGLDILHDINILPVIIYPLQTEYNSENEMRFLLTNISPTEINFLA